MQVKETSFREEILELAYTCIASSLINSLRAMIALGRAGQLSQYDVTAYPRGVYHPLLLLVRGTLARLLLLVLLLMRMLMHSYLKDPVQKEGCLHAGQRSPSEWHMSDCLLLKD